MGEKLTQKYPEITEHVEALPDHIVDRLGETALLLSHRDMHPKIETQDASSEGSTLSTDFETVITDPEYDASLLDQEAREAAEAGHKHVAQLIHTTAEALHSAHASLEEEGFSFTPPTGESDAEQWDRERNEHETVYSRAAGALVEAAQRSHEDGDTTGFEQAVHALLLLEKTKPGYRPNKTPFRQLVRAGMSEELLSACQSAENLVVGESYMHLGSSAAELDTLLQYATGKKLGHGLKVEGDLPPEIGHIGLWDDVVDVVVASSVNPNLSLETFIKNSSWTGLKKISNVKEHYPEIGAIYTDDYIVDLMLEADNGADIDTLAGCSHPLEVARKAKELGLMQAQLIAMTGRRSLDDYNRPVEIDSGISAGLESLSENFPDAFKYLCDNYHSYGDKVSKSPDGAIQNDIGLVMEGLKELGETMSTDIYTEILFGISSRDTRELVGFCQRIEAMLTERGLSHKELLDILQTNATDMRGLYQRCHQHGEKEALSEVILNAELKEEYLGAFETITYPLTTFKGAYEKPGLERFEEIGSRLQALGLSTELSQELFTSWSTYNAYVKQFYDNERGFELPQVEPDNDTLRYIASQQAEAIKKQLEAIETYAAAYGQEVLIETIDTFGIYNFARYDKDKLYDQLQRWKSGERVQTVVVNARSDWNSFTKDGPIFEEGVGDGVFTFEANSGADVARTAVTVGRYEREHDREPSIRKFIIHAHGNGDGMTMGVNGESIDISSYREAARTSKRIGSRDVNAYQRHLGDSFELVLQSCSTAEGGLNSIANVMKDRHSVETHAYPETTHGLIVRSDGSVDFMTNKGDGEPVTFSP